MSRFIQIDEEGYFLSAGARVNDTHYGFELLTHLSISPLGTVTTTDPVANSQVIVEAFSHPLVALQVGNNGQKWHIKAPYNYVADFNLDSLYVDEWDRFCGFTFTNIPFVLSRSAQMQFFDLVDSFDDDSFTFGKKTYSSLTRPVVNYKIDLQSEVSKPLREVLPQLKLPRSKICLVEIQTNFDSEYLKSQGHIASRVENFDELVTLAKKISWLV